MHLTYSEIKGQYKALNETTDCINACMAEVKRQFERCHPRTIVYFGCGSNYYIAESLALATEINLNIPALALPVGDYMLHCSSYTNFLAGSMAVVLSRSGSTAEVIAAVEHLKACTDSPVLSITCTQGSALSAISDYTIEMPWCFDRGACQTRAAACIYMAGLLLIGKLSGNEKLTDGLERAVAGGSSFLDWYDKDLQFIASKAWTNAVLLADAEIAGVAQVGALAFRQICRKPGSHYHLLDARRSALPMITKDTLVITALSDGNQYELELVADIAKLGAQLIVYSDIPFDGMPEKATDISFGKSLPQAARGLPILLIAQLIAYYRAVADGVNPDEY